MRLSIEEGFDVITWRQNADGKGTFVDERVNHEKTSTAFAKNYVTADLDSDGDVDLLFLSINIRWSSSQDKIAWLRKRWLSFVWARETCN